MERNEMLRMLHEQRTAAKLVVLSSEMAIECTYVSKQGFKYEWTALDQWPASMITFTSKETFQKITKRIGEQSLKIEDIQGTVLWTIYTDLFEKTGDVNVIFSELANIGFRRTEKSICSVHLAVQGFSLNMMFLKLGSSRSLSLTALRGIH